MSEEKKKEECEEEEKPEEEAEEEEKPEEEKTPEQSGLKNSSLFYEIGYLNDEHDPCADADPSRNNHHTGYR